MAYSFLEDEELKMLRDSIRKFAKTEISPIAAQLDKDEEFSPELTKKMGELGLFGTVVDPKYSGQGMDYLSYIIAVEELAREDGSQAATIAASLQTFAISAPAKPGVISAKFSVLISVAVLMFFK